MAKETKIPVGGPRNQSTDYDWSQTQGVPTGFEGTRQQDLGIPYLAIIQNGSPQFKKSDPRYKDLGIPGCEEGMLFNTLTNTIVPKPALFIPCYHERLWVEWTPREKGGGIVKVHRTPNIMQESTKNEQGRFNLRNGNLIVETSYFYGLLKGEDGWQQIVLSMTSSNLGEARDWLNRMMAMKIPGPNGTKITPPSFSHIYSIDTEAKQKNNNSWFAYRINLHEMLKDPVLVAKAIQTSQDAARQGQLQLAAPEKPKEDKHDDVPY